MSNNVSRNPNFKLSFAKLKDKAMTNRTAGSVQKLHAQSHNERVSMKSVKSLGNFNNRGISPRNPTV